LSNQLFVSQLIVVLTLDKRNATRRLYNGENSWILRRLKPRRWPCWEQRLKGCVWEPSQLLYKWNT